MARRAGLHAEARMLPRAVLLKRVAMVGGWRAQCKILYVLELSTTVRTVKRWVPTVPMTRRGK